MAVVRQLESTGDITQNLYNSLVNWTANHTIRSIENLALRDTHGFCEKVVIVFASLLPLLILIPCAALHAATRFAWKVLSCKICTTPPVGRDYIHIPFDPTQVEEQASLVKILKEGLPNLEWEDMQQFEVNNAFPVRGTNGPMYSPERGVYFEDHISNVVRIGFIYEGNRYTAFLHGGEIGSIDVLYCHDSQRFLIQTDLQGGNFNWRDALGIQGDQ